MRVLRVPGLLHVPAELPRPLRWSATAGGFELRGPDGTPVATLGFTADGALVGRIGESPVRIAVSGRQRPRTQLTVAGGIELASFSPDWSGLGPVEMTDGVRYAWSGNGWAARGAVLRDAAGATVVRIASDGEGGATVEVYGTLPDGHAAALVTLGFAIVLFERTGPGRTLRLGAAALPRPPEEWM